MELLVVLPRGVLKCVHRRQCIEAQVDFEISEGVVRGVQVEALICPQALKPHSWR